MKEDIREYITKSPDPNLNDNHVDLIGEYEEQGDADPINEAYMQEADVNIDMLSKNDFKESKDQPKAVAILKALAESNEDLANDFMEKLSDKFTEVAEDLGV